jgi:inner membrane organizing system protein 1
MPESTTTPPTPVAARPSKPVSEALLNEKVRIPFPLFLEFPSICASYTRKKELANARSHSQWDKCLSSLLIRSSLGLSFGVVFSVLLFKRRAWPAFVGLGFGAGRAYEECNGAFLRGGGGKEGVRIARP